MRAYRFLVTALVAASFLSGMGGATELGDAGAVGGEERRGGRVFEVDPNSAPEVRTTPPRSPVAFPDDGNRRFDTPLDASVPSAPIELVTDGGFEAGTPNPHWTEESTNFGSPLCTVGTCGTGTGTGPHSGDWWAWFGGIAAPESAAVEQSVVGDGNQVCTLSFWLEIPAASGNGVDFMDVLLAGQNVFGVLENTPGYETYAEVRLDVSDIIDGTPQLLRFESSLTGTAVTNFFVDDVSLECESFPVFPPPGLFAGTGAFDGLVANPSYAVNPFVGSVRGLFSGMPVWGAGFFPQVAVYFTTSTEDAGDIDGSQLMAWNGGLPVPFCILETSGNPLRVDGLAADVTNGSLFMAHQFGDPAGLAGVYAGTTCTNITFLVPLPEGGVSGLAFDPDTQTLYGCDDNSAQVVSINTTTGALTPIAAYPVGVTDVDGLAFDGGKLYLVPDDATTGGIFVYDVDAGMYLDPLPAPWMNADTFSGAAMVPGSIFADGFESGDVSAWSSSNP